MYEKFLDYTVKHLPNIETERLLLRKMTVKDSADMFLYASNSAVCEFLTWCPHESLEYTKKYLKFLVKKYKTGEFLDWGIILKSENRLIGTCGFTCIDFANCKGEIGYVLSPLYQNKGYAEECVKEVIRYAFNTLELNRIEARVMEGNVPSLRLLEKCGFSFEGKALEDIYVKKQFKNVLHYAILKTNCKFL